MASGVYSIENTKNGMVYVGQSANTKTRWREHVRTLNANKHFNQRLQADWNTYGESAFAFTILEKCTYDKLANRERHYIKQYSGMGISYNSSSVKRGVRKLQKSKPMPATRTPEQVEIKVTRQSKRPTGIEATSQFQTLKCLSRHISSTVNKLSHYLDLPVGTVFIHLRLLKIDGYVDVSAENINEVRYTLTEKGRQAVHKDNAALQQAA